MLFLSNSAFLVKYTCKMLTKVPVLIQLIIVHYTTTQAIVDVPICNNTETRLSNLINNTFHSHELPSDLLLVTEKFRNSNKTVLMHNCSDILTLKHYLYERATRPIKRDLPKLYYTALYAYTEMKYQILRHKTYIPKTNADVILLTNSFASAGLNPVLERKLHLYFFYYGNWLEKLTERNFPFDQYKDPRSLLLDMICELINDTLYRAYEREAILFLNLNNHTCFFIENYYRYRKNMDELHSFHNIPKFSSKQLLVEHYSNNTSRSNNSKLEKIKNLNNSNSSDDFIFQNFTITIQNKKVLPNVSFVQIGNESKIFLNFSVVNWIKLKLSNISHGNQDLLTTLKKYETPKLTTQVSASSSLNSTTIRTTATYLVPNQSHPTMYDRQTIQLLNFSTPVHINSPFENVSTRTIPPTTNLGTDEVGTSPYVLDMLQHVHSNLSHINTTHSDINQNYQQAENQHITNFTVWDIVEMEGPCTEGQQHVVKLNVQSLLTAIDEHVSNSSIELFRKLLNNVKSFPIEDYNARGELLRDLLPVISKEQTDPLIKKSIEDILDHVILDGAGALPPKIKLECVNAPAESFKRTARRIRRVFDIQFE